MKQPKKVIFFKPFYQQVYDELKKLGDEYDYGYDPNALQEYDFEIGEYWLHVEWWWATEWYDESFDHAFGTWHDPNAGWLITGIEFIVKVKVEDDEGNEVEGFDVEKFCKDYNIEKL